MPAVTRITRKNDVPADLSHTRLSYILPVKAGRFRYSIFPSLVTLISSAQWAHSQKHSICVPGGAPNAPASPAQYSSVECFRTMKTEPSCMYFMRAKHCGLAHFETIRLPPQLQLSNRLFSHSVISITKACGDRHIQMV